MAITAERVSVESSPKRPLPPPEDRSEREMIQPVTLVPMIAPMMIPIACVRFIIPEFTKPTTITEVAEEDWITAVTPAPSNMPFRGVPDSL